MQLLDASLERILSSPTDIKSWIEINLPLKSQSRVSIKAKRAGVEQSAQLRKRTTPSAAPKPATAAAVKPLPTLLPEGAKGFAVFDLETTGLNTSACSIVEIALVCVDPSGSITETWETLLNPGCTIPKAATGVHNIANQDVVQAPAFADISALLAEKIDQHVLVAHNLSYDFPILERHFRNHSDLELDLGDGICTLRGFGGDPANAYSKKLQHLCSFHSVEFDPQLAHSALGDVLHFGSGADQRDGPSASLDRSCSNEAIAVS